MADPQTPQTAPDMGTSPDFTAIRFFHDDDGWVGTFTGSDISTYFPTFDELTADAALAGERSLAFLRAHLGSA